MTFDISSQVPSLLTRPTRVFSDPPESDLVSLPNHSLIVCQTHKSGHITENESRSEEMRQDLLVRASEN